MTNPAPYSHTDPAEQRSVTIFNYLIDSKFIKADIRTRDKYPNTDGIIEIVDSNQIPLGKLEAQVRTIPKEGKTSYLCPTSLLEYSKKTSLPVILVCVDITLERAFWSHITSSMPEYQNKEGQKSFTVYFSEDGNSIDERGIYIHKWIELVTEYQERINKFPILRSEVGESLELMYMDPRERELFQRYIDAVNNLLDGDLKVIKHLLFPNVWKLGVGVTYSDETQFGFQLYVIHYGEPSSPLVCRLDKRSLFSGPLPANTFSEILCSRTAIENPEREGRNFVLDRLRNIAEKRDFPIYGKLIAAEIIYSFIKSYYRCLGLVPGLDNYLTADLDHALNSHLLGLCAAFAKEHNLDSNTPYIPIDLDWLSRYLSGNHLAPIPPGTSPIIFKLDSKLFSIRSVFESLRYLTGNEIKSIYRPFAKRKPGARWVWGGFSLTDDIESVTRILKNTVSEYKEFIEGNRLYFPDSHFLNEKTSIIYEYKPAIKGKEASRPSVYQHLIQNPNHYLPKISVFIMTDDDHLVDFHEYPTFIINGQSFEGISTSRTDAAFLFRDTPVYDMIYRMLRQDLQEHFNLSITDQF